MTDLQNLELGGSTQKTLWQLSQLVVIAKPGGWKDQTGVWGFNFGIVTSSSLLRL